MTHTKDTPTYSARVTHKHEWHCPKCEFGCYSDKELEDMSPLIKEHQNSHKDTPKETWDQELYKDACTFHAVSMNYKAGVAGVDDPEMIIYHRLKLRLELARREGEINVIEKVKKIRRRNILMVSESGQVNCTDCRNIPKTPFCRHAQGWNDCLDKLLAILKEEQL